MTDTPIREEALGEDDEPILEILRICEALGQVYFLMIAYFEGEGATAAGYLYQRSVGSEEPARNILATNDTLRTLWCSPAGHLWLSSTTGMVWTTAPVPWPSAVTEPGLEYEVPDGDFLWRHATLPRQAHNEMPANGWDIWGTSDDDVYLSTFGGVVYHWNGSVWSQYFSGIGSPIGCIRGRASDDVYAVGMRGTILHFDGSVWKIIADPDGTDMIEPFSGVLFADDGSVCICGGRTGRLLRGNGGDFSVAGRYDVQFIGGVNANGRLIFATKTGVVELAEQGLVVVHDDIVPLSVAEGEEHLYFTETLPAGPSYSQLHLSGDQWRRLSF